MDVTEKYTLAEVTEVAQDVHTKLENMETKIMKANLEQENLVQYVGAYAEGPTKSTLAKMLIHGQNGKPNFGLSAQPLIPPRTSTTRSDGPRPRLPAPRPTNNNFNSTGLNPAGRKLLGQLTGQASASSFSTEPAMPPSRVVTEVCSDNVGGPDGSCAFCHKPLHLFHHPTLPCHMIGKTTLYDSWVNQGKIPYALRPLLNQLIVNHDRVAKGQKPLTKVEFDQQYGSKESGPNASNHAMPTGDAPAWHTGSYDYYHSVPPPPGLPPPTRRTHHAWQPDSSRGTTPPSNAAHDDTIEHFHSYAAVVEHGNPFLRGVHNPTPDEPLSPRDGEAPDSPPPSPRLENAAADTTSPPALTKAQRVGR
ncbi:hypothetical protein CYMTET_42918 [Cymbomonas tetramitiformis]|uniref:Uncharacterized protein n=1 Tax=Cymbomonas tetramitiformis TaxID=36881 RepID=A0AAE0C539_9CHLO|nr:hypothetical protein CYMTET_42918 [Cymbomonas tetramitiformis]